MLFYDLPLDIKNLVLSYNLGDVRLLKIKIVILSKIILISLNQCISLTNQIIYLTIYIILKLTILILILIMDFHIFLI